MGSYPTRRSCLHARRVILAPATPFEPAAFRQVFNRRLAVGRAAGTCPSGPETPPECPTGPAARTLGRFESDRVVVGPGSLGEEAEQAPRPSREEFAGQEFMDAIAHLSDRLFGLIRKDKCLVIDLRNRLCSHALIIEAAGYCPSCGSTGPMHRVLAHHDLVGRQCDQCSSRHGVVRHEHA